MITNENDKFKKVPGRKAAKNDEDSKFLNHDALDDDLIDSDIINEESEADASIVNSDHPENQEWNARENEKHP